MTTSEVFICKSSHATLFVCLRKTSRQTKGEKMSDIKTLYRSKSNRMIAGVCAGLGDYLNIDPTIIRLLFVLGFFTFNGAMLLVYLIMAIVTPEG
jgi:phage shock protein PspC (stress-responsive transcriptional regulator)